MKLHQMLVILRHLINELIETTLNTCLMKRVQVCMSLSLYVMIRLIMDSLKNNY